MLIADPMLNLGVELILSEHPRIKFLKVMDQLANLGF